MSLPTSKRTPGNWRSRRRIAGRRLRQPQRPLGQHIALDVVGASRDRGREYRVERTQDIDPGTTHLVAASLASATGIKLTYVHYKGVAQGAIDLVAGRTHISSGTLSNALPNIKSGKLRVMAVLGAERSRVLPDVKTAMEQGVDIEYTSWMGAFAPAATPAAIVNKLNAEFVKAIRAPDVMKQLEIQGSEAVASTADAFRKKLVTELAYWKKLIQDEGIKAEE